MEKKQTAVEWLVSQQQPYKFFTKIIIEQAKEIEKEQIIDASATAYEDMFGTNGNEYGENYYNKKFNN